MNNLIHLKLVQHSNLPVLKAAAKKTVASLQRYIKVRNWHYTTYDEIVRKAKADDMATKKIYLNADGDAVSSIQSPVCVLFICDGHVGAYVHLHKTNYTIKPMSKSFIENLPPTVF